MNFLLFLLNIKAPEGTEITLRFSEEIFDNGEINPASCGGYATFVIQTDKYICKGSGEEEIWEPRFSYHGFRQGICPARSIWPAIQPVSFPIEIQES